MSYIGNTTVNQNYVPAIDYFNGDGSTVAFTLSRPVASVAAVQVTISNVPQNPGSAFTVSGSTITFTSAPPSGTSNIYVYYTSRNTQVVQPGQGTVGTVQIADGAVTAAKLASGLSIPAGAVQHFAMSTAPTGWLPANGAAVSRTTYATLFTAIGTTFGTGDGSTTFNVPDLGGQFIRSWESGQTTDSGRTFGSSQSADVGYHTHNFAGAVQGSGSSGNWVSNVPSVAGPLNVSGDIRPVNVALLACIKY